MADVLTSQHAFIASGSQKGRVGCYTRGSRSINFAKKSAYLFGASEADASIGVYLEGNISISGSFHAFIVSLSENVSHSLYAYTYGIIRSSIPVYLIGESMAQVDYIWFKTSDSGATLSKKFRVLQQDYDDGTLEKAEDINKTIGGGIDHSIGAIYKTWSMIIKVRHTETQADYGDLADLEYLYSLNNPGGTPSNDITFIDHHQTEYTVHTVGKLTKNLLGCQVEGEDAWYLYKLQLLRVQ